MTEAPPTRYPALPAPLRALFEASGVGLCLLDTGWRVRHANQPWLAIAGVSLEEAVGRSIGELFPDAPAVALALLGGPLPAAPVRLAPFHRLQAGREAWLAGQVAPLELEDGPGLVLTVVDVTEHERTGARLREALAAADRRAAEVDAIIQAIPHAVYFGRTIGAVAVNIDLTDQHRLRSQWQLALSAADMGWWRYDPARRVAEFDARFGRLFGVAEGELPAEALLERVHPEDAPRVREAFQAAVAQAGVEPYGIEFRTRDGGVERRIHAHGAAVFDGEGPGRRVAGFTGTVADVTERRRSEEELGRLAAAVEQAPSSVVITDAAGAIQYVNPAFERITGYGEAEVLGNRAAILKSGKHDQAFYRELWGTITAGRVWKGRLVNRAKDGRLFTEDASIAPVVDARGVIRNYVAVKHDVTEELARQESLAQAQRLETVGRLAGGVAHDFNNLLTVIQSCGESLRRATGRGLPVSADDVEQINEATRRASDLTRQLLAFARRQANAPEPIDLNRTLGEARRMLERLLGEDVELRLSLQPELWPVRSDPGLLDQLLLNLAANARDALPRGGRVQISTGNLEVAAGSSAWPMLRPGQYVRLEFHDDGVGMTAEVLEHAFEPFYTTKGVGTGTGLGLATVHGIVTQSGGAIRVESAPGLGTRFVVALPRSEQPAGAPVKPEEAAPDAGGQETILLVEDEPAVRKQVLRALAGAGYQVHLAGDGKEALELARTLEDPPDLLLSDVIMPRMDGARLAEALRVRWPGLPVLFMSGYTDERLEPTGLLGGSSDLLQKPFTGSVLLKRVRQALDRRSGGAGGRDGARST